MQFSDEPKRCHHTEPCNHEGTIFRDCTRGPLYDPRWYCEDHIEEADAVQQQISKKAALSYQRSKVVYLEKDLARERVALAEMES